MCCKLIEIPSLNSDAGKWCKHCEPKSGCMIYERRPEFCQTFKCAWLAGYLPDEYRPSKCKMVFSDVKDGFLVYVDPTMEDSVIERPDFKRIVKLLGTKNDVFIVSGKKTAKVQFKEKK